MRLRPSHTSKLAPVPLLRDCRQDRVHLVLLAAPFAWFLGRVNRFVARLVGGFLLDICNHGFVGRDPVGVAPGSFLPPDVDDRFFEWCRSIGVPQPSADELRAAGLITWEGARVTAQAMREEERKSEPEGSGPAMLALRPPSVREEELLDQYRDKSQETELK